MGKARAWVLETIAAADRALQGAVGWRDDAAPGTAARAGRLLAQEPQGTRRALRTGVAAARTLPPSARALTAGFAVEARIDVTRDPIDRRRVRTNLGVARVDRTRVVVIAVGTGPTTAADRFGLVAIAAATVAIRDALDAEGPLGVAHANAAVAVEVTGHALVTLRVAHPTLAVAVGHALNAAVGPWQEHPGLACRAWHIVTVSADAVGGVPKRYRGVGPDIGRQVVLCRLAARHLTCQGEERSEGDPDARVGRRDGTTHVRPFGFQRLSVHLSPPRARSSPGTQRRS